MYFSYLCITEQITWSSTKARDAPLIALVALDDDIRLGILPGSVNLVSFQREMVACQIIEYKFRRGEVFLMHPAFVHYGCAYKAGDKSLRAHYYFDNPTISRGTPGEQTFLFQEVVQPMPLNQCTKKKKQDLVMEEQMVPTEEDGQDPRTSKKEEKKRATKPGGKKRTTTQGGKIRNLK